MTSGSGLLIWICQGLVMENISNSGSISTDRCNANVRVVNKWCLFLYLFCCSGCSSTFIYAHVFWWYGHWPGWLWLWAPGWLAVAMCWDDFTWIWLIGSCIYWRWWWTPYFDRRWLWMTISLASCGSPTYLPLLWEDIETRMVSGYRILLRDFSTRIKY